MAPKPSPLVSILMFAGSLLLLIAIFSSSWWSASEGDASFSVGLVRGSSCHDGECRSMTIFDGRMRIEGIIAIITVLITFAGIVCAVISGIFLFKPGRSALAIVAMSLVGGGALFAIVYILMIKTRGMGISYGLPMFFLGFAAVLTGSIMAMVRPRAGPPMGMNPGMRPPMGNPYGGQPQYGAPQANPYAQPGMPGPGMPGQPPQGQPQQNPYAPPPQAQPAPVAAAAPSGAAAQGAPCGTCQTPTTWVAQYNRWFCTRCNQYI